MQLNYCMICKVPSARRADIVPPRAARSPIMASLTLHLQPLEPGASLGLLLENKGNSIRSVALGSASGRAGFEAGDVILAVDGVRLPPDNMTAVAKAVRGDPAKPGREKRIEIWRPGAGKQHTSEPAAQDEREAVELHVPVLPVGAKLGLSIGTGNVVRSIKDDGYGVRIGVRVGDVIASIDGCDVGACDTVETARALRGDPTVIVKQRPMIVYRVREKEGGGGMRKRERRREKGETARE